MITSPVLSLKMTAGYLEDRGGKIHGGVDLISHTSKTVYSIAEGIVVFDFDGYNPKYRWDCALLHSCGNFVKIAHIIDNRWYLFRYVHLSKNTVSAGNYVESGTPIGVYSNAGFSFGDHLHMDATNQFGIPINIEEFFRGKGII